jgi:hypothetical protein
VPLGGTQAGPALDALRTVLQRVEQTARWRLDEDDDALATAMLWFRTAMPRTLTLSERPPWTRDRDQDLSDRVALTLSNQDLFHPMAVGIGELRRLCAQGATLAVRDLGYAFHNFPGLLAKPK